MVEKNILFKCIISFKVSSHDKPGCSLLLTLNESFKVSSFEQPGPEVDQATGTLTFLLSAINILHKKFIL